MCDFVVHIDLYQSCSISFVRVWCYITREQARSDIVIKACVHSVFILFMLASKITDIIIKHDTYHKDNTKHFALSKFVKIITQGNF